MGRLASSERFAAGRTVRCVVILVFKKVVYTDRDSLYLKLLARKELNFEKMSERDRKQIVAEVYVTSAFCAATLVELYYTVIF